MRPTASTWPCTTWPPSGSPTRSADSRFTRSSAASPPRAVRDSVSGTTSNARRPSPASTTVRHTPATETESPTATPPAVSGAPTTSREPSKAATVPTSRTMPVNTRQRLRLVQVRLQQHVLAGRLEGEGGGGERRWGVAEGRRAVPPHGGGDREEQLVEHAH